MATLGLLERPWPLNAVLLSLLQASLQSEHVDAHSRGGSDVNPQPDLWSGGYLLQGMGSVTHGAWVARDCILRADDIHNARGRAAAGMLNEEAVGRTRPYSRHILSQGKVTLRGG